MGKEVLPGNRLGGELVAKEILERIFTSMVAHKLRRGKERRGGKKTTTGNKGARKRERGGGEKEAGGYLRDTVDNLYEF